MAKAEEKNVSEEAVVEAPVTEEAAPEASEETAAE